MNNAAEAAVTEDKSTVRVPLDNPLKRGDETITAVTLRKPLGGATSGTKLVDLLNLDLVAASKVVPRISSPVITAVEFLNMDVEDCTAIAGEIAAFLLQKRQKEAHGL
ncbi:phage tail assembly protein [Brevundimonas naejangsanensis]|uniref:phage tail assembly protein n=1 Tax=Brevundimonas naejangsanensis TaxID=588932 RepID=UPI0034D786BF